MSGDATDGVLAQLHPCAHGSGNGPDGLPCTGNAALDCEGCNGYGSRWMFYGEAVSVAECDRRVKAERDRCLAIVEAQRVHCERTAATFPAGSPMRFGRNGGVEAALAIAAGIESGEPA